MSIAYVYAPITAWTYHHGSSGGCSNGVEMMDISRDAAVGNWINLYVSYPTIKSVEFQRPDNCCPCTQNTKNAVKVLLYGEYNKNCYLGAILYGHMTNPISPGWTNLNGNFGGQIGKVLGTDYCWCYGNPSTGTGAHVHTEVWLGTRTTYSGQYVYQGSTVIYQWAAGYC